jgi:hypothetical protein
MNVYFEIDVTVNTVIYSQYTNMWLYIVEDYSKDIS